MCNQRKPSLERQQKRAGRQMRVKKGYCWSPSLTVPSVRTETSMLKCDPQSVKSKWAEKRENSGSQCPASTSVQQLRVPWRGHAAERQHLRAAALGTVRCAVKEDSVPVPPYSHTEIICRPNQKKKRLSGAAWTAAWWSSEEAENHRPWQTLLVLGGKRERHMRRLINGCTVVFWWPLTSGQLPP